MPSRVQSCCPPDVQNSVKQSKPVSKPQRFRHGLWSSKGLRRSTLYEETLTCCEPRQSVLDGSEDFVVNLSAFSELSEAEAAEFLDADVLTSRMEDLRVL